MSRAVRGSKRGRPRGATGNRVTITTPVVSTKPTVFKCPACFLVFNAEAEMTDHEVTHSELYDFECGQCGNLFETIDLLKSHFTHAHMVNTGDEHVTVTASVPSNTVPMGIPNNNYGNLVPETNTNAHPPSLGLVEITNPTDNNFPVTVGTTHYGGIPQAFNPGNVQVQSQEPVSMPNVIDDSSNYSGDYGDDDDRGGYSPTSTGMEETDGSSSVVSEKVQVNSTVNVPVVNKDRPYVCEQCGKDFNLHRTFRDHLRRHNAEFRYFCEVVGCGKGFVRKQERDRHEIRVHVPPEHRPSNFVCNECGRSYTQRAHLSEHMKKHTMKEAPYKCELCEKRFWQQSALKTHMLSIKHGGTGVSYRNKPKPKRPGPRLKPGPKPKNRDLIDVKEEELATPKRKKAVAKTKQPAKKTRSKIVEEESEEEGETTSEEDDGAQEGSDEEYMPPEERKRVAEKSSAKSANAALAYSSMPKLEFAGYPHEQPQKNAHNMPTLNYQQNVPNDQNPMIWRGNPSTHQFTTFGNHQQAMGQSLGHIPPGGMLTLQDAFQMGYGIPHQSLGKF